MRKANKYVKEKVIAILSETFVQNPGVNSILKKGGDHHKNIRSLMTYAVIKANSGNGIFISSNRKGAALCYKYNKRRFSLAEILYGLKFGLTAIGIRRLRQVLKREAYRASVRPESGEYLYFWFLGVLPGGNGAGYELKRMILDEARRENLPIYLETTLEKNKRIYERFGFRTYRHWRDESTNVHFWFMKWEPAD